MENLKQRTINNIQTIRKKRPLIHHITNFVVMNLTANVTLALGASPVMAHSPDEVEEMVQAAGALTLNIGTLTREWIDAMILAGKKANERNIPVILDPVGAGATSLRTEESKRILTQINVSILRGNAGEILSLSGDTTGIKGVDSLQDSEKAEETAQRLAKTLNAVLVISGIVDLITDGNRLLRVGNGHPLMGWITGSGCSATAVVAAFASVDPDPILAAATGMAYYGLAGEKAAKKSHTPGSFQVFLMDSLYDLTEEEILKGIKIKQEK